MVKQKQKNCNIYFHSKREGTEGKKNSHWFIEIIKYHKVYVVRPLPTLAVLTRIGSLDYYSPVVEY